ncbi:MAG: hypothetical protein LBD75_04260 [Candidatus Peribacteria bacterium]|nr:hypothetical protein [Candidatus Peribacteria bacterium]
MAEVGKKIVVRTTSSGKTIPVLTKTDKINLVPTDNVQSVSPVVENKPIFQLPQVTASVAPIFQLPKIQTADLNVPQPKTQSTALQQQKIIEQGKFQSLQPFIDTNPLQTALMDLHYTSPAEQIQAEKVNQEIPTLLKGGILQSWDLIRKKLIRNAQDNYTRMNKYTNINEAPEGAENFFTKAIAEGDKEIETIDKNYKKWVDEHYNIHLQQTFTQKPLTQWVKEGNLPMVKYGVVQGISTSILPMIPTIATALITKNPQAMVAAGFIPANLIEDQSAYEEALKE